MACALQYPLNIVNRHYNFNLALIYMIVASTTIEVFKKTLEYCTTTMRVQTVILGIRLLCEDDLRNSMKIRYLWFQNAYERFVI